MKPTVKLTLILIILALLISACAPAATPPALETPTQPPAPTATLEPTTPPEPTAVPATSTPAPIVIADGLGGELSLAQPAQRIISLAPSNTEILFAVGAAAQVIAREDFSNYPEAALDLPSVGGNMGAYNLEQMVELSPPGAGFPIERPRSAQGHAGPQAAGGRRAQPHHPGGDVCQP